MDLGASVYGLKRKLELTGTSGLAVDLDDTIFATAKKFHQTLSEQFPPPEEITAEKLRKNYALNGTVLYWENIPAAMELISTLVDCNEFHQNIEKLPYALEGMNRLVAADKIACYATARIKSLEDLTRTELNSASFPEKPLITRPNKIDFSCGSKWKAAILQYLYPHVNGIIEDNIRTVRILEESGYKGHIFLIGLNESDYQSSNERTHIHEAWPELTDNIIEVLA